MDLSRKGQHAKTASARLTCSTSFADLAPPAKSWSRRGRTISGGRNLNLERACFFRPRPEPRPFLSGGRGTGLPHETSRQRARPRERRGSENEGGGFGSCLTALKNT